MSFGLGGTVGGILFGNGPLPGGNTIPTSYDLTPNVSPGKYPIKLGAITFSTEETPEHFQIGASEQMLVIHNLPGGGIANYDFGNKPKDISWTGRFWGPNIGPRVAQIQLYKQAGEELLLSYARPEGVVSCYVKIADFEPGYGGAYNEYSITLKVTRDANGMFAVPSSPTVDQQVAALMAQATIGNQNVTTIDPGGAASYNPELQTLLAILAASAPLAQNLIGSSVAILAAASAALVAMRAYQATLPSTAPQMPDLRSLIASVQGVYTVVQQGEAPESMTVEGGDLYRIAAMHYGDVSLAFPLARANGLVHPLLPTGVRMTIKLPNLIAA